MSRQAKDVVVRLKALDGFWETCGSDRARGIVPENVVLSANPWGSDQATFSLRRDPKALWPDIGAFTPVKVEVGGVRVWSGRVKETPSKDGTDRIMSVTCEGWQYHLDDDLYERTYVQNKLGDWKDARGTLSEDLNSFTTSGSVQAGDGAIVLGWPNGTILKAGDRMGVVLDMGPSTTAKLAQVEFRGISVANLGAGATIYVVTHPTPESAGQSLADAGTLALSSLGTSTNAIGRTFATAYRYVSVFLYNQSAITLSGDVAIRIEAARIFPSASYAGAGNLSVLKAPVVINDALDRATMLLSVDRSQIDPAGTVTFNIPSLAASEPRTPREMWDAVNAYHNYMSKIDVDARAVFAPRPARPKYTVGSWSPMELEDASANSSLDIYNRALGTGQDVSGNPLRVSRLSSHVGATTVIDRRGFQRTKALQIRSTLPADGLAAAQLGDVWLSGHTTTPFKGTVKLTGDQAVRNRTEGTSVPLERLLLDTGELLHFSDRVHPDSGSWGRDGRLTQVQWAAASNEATVTLDNTRADFETMLERLAVVTGGS